MSLFIFSLNKEMKIAEQTVVDPRDMNGANGKLSFVPDARDGA